MKLYAIDSSVIDEIGYGQSELLIVFRNGNRYMFQDVSPDEFQRLLTAESKGHYFNEYIRDRYFFREV